MKGIKGILAALTVISSLGQIDVTAAGYETNFNVQGPYTEGDPVAGVDGWENANEEANQNAVVIRNPWVINATTLALKKSSANEPNFNLRNRLAAPLEGDVRADITLAFHFPPGKSSDGVFIFAFSNPSAVSPRIGIGMSFSEDGGLYYYSEGERITILPKSEVKIDSAYQFSLKVNLMGKYFDLAVTGSRADGSDFSFSVSDVPFAALPKNRISNIYLWQSLPNQWATYVSAIRVHNLLE